MNKLFCKKKPLIETSLGDLKLTNAENLVNLQKFEL